MYTLNLKSFHNLKGTQLLLLINVIGKYKLPSSFFNRKFNLLLNIVILEDQYHLK